MRSVNHLTSLDNPRVKEIVRLREQRHRRRSGRFVVESVRQITRAMDAGLTPAAMMWCEGLLGGAADDVQRINDQAGQRSKEYRGFTVTEALIRKMAYRENPQGVVGVFEQPTWSLADVLGQVVQDGGMCLVAVGIEKPGNLGAMARSAAAAGAAGLVVADGVVDCFNPNVIRASTGAVFSLPVVGGLTEDLIPLLQEQGINMVTAMPQAEVSCYDADLTGPLALIIGSEDCGLASTWQQAGKPITIPMLNEAVDSLNASAAAAVLLFEAVGQRRHVK